MGYLTDVKKCTSITQVCRKKVAILCQIMLVHINTYPQMAAGFFLLDNVLTTYIVGCIIQKQHDPIVPEILL